MFRTRRFIFRKAVVYTVMVERILHASVEAVLLVEGSIRYFHLQDKIILQINVCLQNYQSINCNEKVKEKASCARMSESKCDYRTCG